MPSVSVQVNVRHSSAEALGRTKIKLSVSQQVIL